MAGSIAESTIPVRIPKAISNYTASTLDPEIRSSVNSRLLTDGHIPKIHDALLHAFHASPTNWPTLIQSHALSLLRNGECTTFHEVLKRVLDDIHADTVIARSTSNNVVSTNSISNGHSLSNKNNSSNGNKITTKPGADMNSQTESKRCLALPPNVVEEGLRITRELLETICEVDDQSWE